MLKLIFLDDLPAYYNILCKNLDCWDFEFVKQNNPGTSNLEYICVINKQMLRIFYSKKNENYGGSHNEACVNSYKN